MLRDYQTEICNKVEDALKKERSVMMQMPTGTGKTVVLAEIVKRYLDGDNLNVNINHNHDINKMHDGCRVLIVAHRIELIEQTGAFLERHGIDYGVIAGGRLPKKIKAVMVASVQTLARNIDNLNLDVYLYLNLDVNHERKGGKGAVGLRTSYDAIQVLVSVDLFSEGFDCPDVEFIQIARPTLSLAKYLQMVGRGLRPSSGKTSCIILDNVGLYKTFGLPTSDRDWEGYFVGDADELTAIRDESKVMGALRFSPIDIKDDTEKDREVVRIVTHDELAARFVNTVSDGFIRKKKGKTWVCQDTVTGIEFERHPRVIEYRGMEMVTADSETYYPRIRSQWIDAIHGINVKALETQTGDGLSWKMLYVSLSSPDKVYKLQEVMYNDMRIYKDETGKTYFQQDLDHPLVSETEAGGRQAFIAYCDKRKEEWLTAMENVKHRFIDKAFLTSEWQREHKAVVEKDGAFYHVSYEEQGERKEVWADEKTGFYFLHKPVMNRRGFVELLHDGEMVFVRNIYYERYIPYRCWEIKADERLCAIGNRLYMREKPDAEGYRILKRSSDFVMFVVQGNDPKTYDRTYTIINKMGREVERKESE